MNKKKQWIFTFLITSLVCLGSVHTLLAGNQNLCETNGGPEIILDQSHENDQYEGAIHHHVMLAQSFTPSLSPLTKIDIKINKPRKTVAPLEIRVKKSFDGPTLASKSIAAEDVPFFSYWLSVDITDIDVDVGDQYLIIVSSSTPSEAPYRWGYGYSETQDLYPSGALYRSFDNAETWNTVETEFEFVDAAFRTYSYIGHPLMHCEGYLNWTNVQPAQDNLTGFFTVENLGTPYSNLNWEIYNWPYWGTWNFSSMKGTNLHPEDGVEVISIQVEAPHSNVPDLYEGKIVIVNSDDANETAEIYARLVTRKSKTIDVEPVDLQMQKAFMKTMIRINDFLFKVSKHTFVPTFFNVFNW